MATLIQPDMVAGLSGYVEEDRENAIFRVHRSVFTDEELFAKEREAIFSTCWLYLGHVSELARNGDFVTRSVGGRELIFNRDRGGNLNAFHNVCPHRGAMVLRDARGNAPGFRCFYHGWTFHADGRFASRFPEGDYGAAHYESGCADLKRVARMEEYRGLYFVNFDPDAESLSDFLAGAKEFIDLVIDQSETELEIIGGEQQYVINANWKLLAENNADGFHAPVTHSTYMNYLGNVGNLPKSDEAISAIKGGREIPPGKAFDLGNGHAVIEYPAAWGRPVARWVPSWGEDSRGAFKAIFNRLIERHGEERARRIARLNRNLIIFPNLAINDIMATTVRTFFPENLTKMRVSGWAIGVKDEPARVRELRLENFLEFMGPGGFATPDDIEAVESCQRGYSNIREASWNDVSKGMLRGTATHYDDELQMRSFWREWDRRMAAHSVKKGS